MAATQAWKVHRPENTKASVWQMLGSSSAEGHLEGYSRSKHFEGVNTSSRTKCELEPIND